MSAVSATDLHLIGQGAEAEIFEWDDGRVVKLLRSGVRPERMAFEVASIDAARSTGVRVPRTYEQVVVDGRSGVVMERLQGTDLLSLIGRTPWLVFRSGRLTGEIHARINATRAPETLPRVTDVTRDALRRLRQRETGLALESVERVLSQLPDGEALCHGDFHPGQVIVSNGESVAIDWPGAKRGDPLFDYARTRIVLSIGEPPPGTPPVLRLLAKVGRGLLLASYARSYERHAATPVDNRRLRQWELVNLAVRLVENVPGERPRLLRRLLTDIKRLERLSPR